MKRMSYTTRFLAASIMVMVAVSAVNFYVDPFTYYHQPWTTINFSRMHRFSNPGLARQYEYEAVLVGTSHVMELESSRYSEITGMKGLNLATNGGSIREQAELVELVLRQGKATVIHWEMNFPSFSLGDVVGTLGEQHPGYFYRPGIETPIRYLASFDTLVQSWKALDGAGSITIDNRNELVGREYSDQRVSDHWDYEMQVWSPQVRAYWAAIQRGVEAPETILRRRLEPLLAAYPEVSFELLLPPHHVMFFLLHEAMGADDFDKWLAFRDAVTGLAEGYPNAVVHDFQADHELLTDSGRYRDLEHFDPAMLASLIAQVSAGTRVTDAVAARENTRRLEQLVRGFGREFCQRQPDRCPDYLRNRLD